MVYIQSSLCILCIRSSFHRSLHISSMMHHPLHIITCHPHYILSSLHIHTSLQTSLCFILPYILSHPSEQHSLHPLHATAILYHPYVFSLHMVHDTLICPTCHPTHPPMPHRI